MYNKNQEEKNVIQIYLNFIGFKQHTFCENYQTSPTTLLLQIHNKSNKEVQKNLKTLFYMYRKVASSKTARLEAHAGFFRLLMKKYFLL